MIDQASFMETVRSVQEIIRTSAKPLTREEIEGYFEDMELDAAQKEMVFEYLTNPKNMQQDIREGREAEEGQIPETGEEAEEGQNIEAEQEFGSAERKESGRSAGKRPKGESSVHFHMYLEEIEEIPVLGQAEKAGLYERLLGGEQEVIPEISGQWLKRVMGLAGEYENAGVPVEDMVQEGNIGLLTGLGQLAGRQGQDLSDIEDFLTGCIREAIEAYLEEEGKTDVRENTILGKVSLIHQAQETLTREKGVIPSLRELSDYTKIPEEEIRDILALAKESEKI